MSDLDPNFEEREALRKEARAQDEPLSGSYATPAAGASLGSLESKPDPGLEPLSPTEEAALQAGPSVHDFQIAHEELEATCELISGKRDASGWPDPSLGSLALGVPSAGLGCFDRPTLRDPAGGDPLGAAYEAVDQLVDPTSRYDCSPFVREIGQALQPVLSRVVAQAVRAELERVGLTTAEPTAEPAPKTGPGPAQSPSPVLMYGAPFAKP